jgi:hypothetical protein
MLACRACVTLDRAFKRKFPWPHDDGASDRPVLRVHLRGAMGGLEVGTFLAAVCDANSLGFDDEDRPLETAGAIFDQVSAADTMIAPGGLEVRSGDQVVVAPACCCGLEDWREWIAFLDADRNPPWCGHDPEASCERLPEGRIRLGSAGRAGVLVTVAAGDLRAALREVERDLVAFKDTLAGWARRTAPANADHLVEALDTAFRFTRPAA